MIDDPIIEELHRHREELFREFGNDPEALLKHLQQKERQSGLPVEAPPSPGTSPRRIARR